MSSGLQKIDLTSQGFKNDPIPVIRGSQKAGSLIRTKLPLIGKCYLTTTHAATTDLLKGKDRFAMQPKNAGKRDLTWWFNFLPQSMRRLSKNMLTSDEPDHRRLRSLVDQAFHRQSLADLRSRVEELCDAYLDRLESANQDPVDFVSTVARPFPLTVICEMLGIPEKDRPQLMGVFEGMLKSNNLFELIRLLPKFKELTNYFEGLFETVRANPGPGLISALVHAEEDGDQLDKDELMTMVYLLFVAGHETTVHLLSGGLWALEKFPEERERLRKAPAIIETGIDELLRFVSPVMITKPRFAKQDMEFHGTQVRRGEMIIGFLAAANFDEAVFEDPEELNLSRKPNPHTSFGGGIHFCLGFQLARMEGQILFTKLLERYPDVHLAIDPDDVLWYKRFGLRGLSELPVTV
ncbi:MAG: cytochrome P450 [Verrucomicrobiales bacterium]|nr:cytochrome P450 [Verrucomicrobiales bacterium]